ncbi:MAG: bifunctional methylenetetrahydrofolate dehydrogenase/methenyltetrahydrofolate cyclohydrolase [Bifidobacteriaceae bacterium]|jgi:methylenetetrahydrofolate dehydrogenase (NADP+)/methenyltetrahydrofolate cyclohydrolase|nr:bifunctional methylenetetrahydrofolate dehydrogenase/methenyltetrahydrofolate cyclohydrolase [Bifidobacteriaceae bacterium]
MNKNIAIKLDGQKIYKEGLEDLKTQICDSPTLGINQISTSPTLGIIQVGDNPASTKYVTLKIKDIEYIGAKSVLKKLPSSHTTEQIIEAVNDFNNDKNIDAYIVQLPLPDHIDTELVLNSIDPKKDADGLHPINVMGLIDTKTSTPIACTPLGIIQLLKCYNIETDGANVVIVGRGATVGRPLSLLLSNSEYNSTVTLAHSHTKDLQELCKNADILVAATGYPGLINKDFIKVGATVISTGVTYIDGKLCADTTDDVAEVAGYLTPNPGGVGPMTRLCLLKNLITIANK